MSSNHHTFSHSVSRPLTRASDEHAQQVQARLAGQFAAALSERTLVLPHDITERLRFARERSMQKAREVRLATQAAPAALGVTSGGALMLGGSAPWWQRALSVLPLLMLVAGMVLIDRWSAREQIVAIADVDAVLLADDLPPDAYRDPGFAEFLRSPPP